MFEKLLNSQLILIYYKLSHIPTVKVNTHLTILSVQGKMKCQPLLRSKGIGIEIIAILSYNSQNIKIANKSSSAWGGAWI
jgi:hypothetical protein